MKTPLLIFGVFALLIGFVWIGQGTGYFPFPASSFMIRQIQWSYYGAGLAVVGLIMVLMSRRG